MSNILEVIKSGDYLILDTETTGLGSDAEICQIAIIDAQGNVLLDTLVKPVKDIPSEATAIHGISNEAVLEAPYFIEVANKILELITGKHVIIYNVEYDTRLLYQSSGYPQIDWHKDTTYWCAMLAFAEIYGDYNSYRQSYRWKTLNVACNYYKVDNDNAHSALSDCKATLAICKAMAASEAVE